MRQTTLPGGAIASAQTQKVEFTPARRTLWRVAQSWLAIATLWAATIGFYWRLYTPDLAARRYVGPGDFGLSYFQYHVFAALELARGRLAQWDPFMYSGYPFQADTQTAVLYPIALANEWLHGAAYSFLDMEWEAIVHIGLAATFTFLLVRLLSGSLAAGLLGALTFAFGGFLTSYPVDQIAVLESTVWLPLELYCIERAARVATPLASRGNRGARTSAWLALAGACVALAMLAGHPQTVLYVAYLGAAYALFRLPWRQWRRAIWMALAALGLSAVQLLPALQLMRLSDRSQLSFSFAAGGLLPGDFVALVANAPAAGRILYAGVVPLALALLAIAVVRDRQVAFWGAVAAIGALLSLGSHGPVYRFFFAYLPGWNLFRDQERAVVWFALAVAVLAGLGLARVLDWASRGKVLRRTGVATLAAALLLVSFGNLYWANHDNKLSNVAPPDLPELRAFLAPVLSDKDVFRVRVSETSVGQNEGNALHLQFVTGDSPFVLKAYKNWTEGQPGAPRVTEWPLLRLTNSHYVISSRDLCQGPCAPSDGLHLLDTDATPRQVQTMDPLPRFVSVPTLRLYQVLFPLPRAFFVTQATAVDSQRQAIDAINRPGFDGGQTILLQGPRVPHSSPPDAAAQLHTDVVGYAPGFVDVRTSSDRPAYLFLSEVAYPDWQATIDGKPAPLLLADGLFNALDVNPGQHHVVLRYVPRLFYIGAAISALTLLILVLSPLLSRRKGAR